MNRDTTQGVVCNECAEVLTSEELAVYPLQWQYSGDMYCEEHRDCPDDCRRTPCLQIQSALEQEVEQS